MSCPCDTHPCRTPLAVAAGLALLPRAPAAFPAWREALLAAVGRETALDGWRAREAGDLGLMLVEMAAYVLDVTSFYDEWLANESYLRTASLAGQARRHVELLGYLPRPAVGSRVWMAAEADGTRVVHLPAGLAVRSGEFEGPAGKEPPQVFELEAATTIDPRINRFEVQRVGSELLPNPLPGLDAEAGSVRVRAGDIVVLDDGSALAATRVAAVTRPLLRIRTPVVHIAFDGSVAPTAGASYAAAQLLRSGATCGAWKLAPEGSEPLALSEFTLSLDGKLNLRVGEIVVLENGVSGALAARRVQALAEVQYTLIAALTSELKDAGGTVTGSITSPPIKVAVTQLTFAEALPPFEFAAATLVLHHTLQPAATLHTPLKDTLAQGDPMALAGFIDAPRTEVTKLLLQDVHGDAVATTGALDAASQSASGDSAPAWGRELWAPVQLHANVFELTRGETVKDESLGFGDATLPGQTFRLKKSPLTYLAAATASGRKSTLTVYVGGIQWQEVESFHGVDAAATVYTVRHDEQGQTELHFGGGARLPSGAPVLASYRFGAGHAVPPAESVKQLVRPVVGLRKLRNLLPAYGGADAESAAELVQRAPQSALLIGRAISLADFEVAAAAQPGVRAARSHWRWDAQGLAPVVDVVFIGDAQLTPTITAALRALAEADAPMAVRAATAQPALLEADLEIDPLHVADDVIAAVHAALFAPVLLPGSGGLLRAERLGPDGVLFQSKVVHAVMGCAGVLALRSLALDGTPFVDTGRLPAAGAYFDFEAGGVLVNGVAAAPAAAAT